MRLPASVIAIVVTFTTGALAQESGPIEQLGQGTAEPSTTSGDEASSTQQFGANAQEAPPEGTVEEDPEDRFLGQLSMGWRVGWASPLGKITRDDGGAKLDELVGPQVPIWLDGTYEPLPFLSLGLYATWAAGSVPAGDDMWGCPPDNSCFAHTLRGGAQAHLHLAPMQKINPWFGLGAGYEFAFAYNVWVNSEAAEKTRRVNHGAEIINVQLGVDYKPNPKFGIGPFVSFSVGRYAMCSTKIDTSPVRCDIERRAQHEWLVVGLRTTFALLAVRRQRVTL